ncbi:hypothetical protein OROGR_019649 [Orobanche gracilis]
MSATVEAVDLQLVQGFQDLVTQCQKLQETLRHWGNTGMDGNSEAVIEEINLGRRESNQIDINDNHGVCAICLNKIVLQETALVKGCEHAYWYKEFISLSSWSSGEPDENSSEVSMSVLKFQDSIPFSCFSLTLQWGIKSSIFADGLTGDPLFELTTSTCTTYTNFLLVIVTCILRWASCKKEATCPQCKTRFEFLNIHRALDGSVMDWVYQAHEGGTLAAGQAVDSQGDIHDYMFEESLCLLLRASWYKPLVEVEKELDKIEDYCYYDNEEEDLAESYFCSSSSPRIGNRRWGDNGYVRAGRQEARPTYRLCGQDSDAGSSRQPKKETLNKVVGRRAKRASKRESADKAAAAKHQQHLARLGRK